MERAVILGAARTPFGRFGGALAPLSAPELGGAAIREAVDRSGVEDGEIGHSVFGIVVQAGVGQIPSRQANRHAGLPFGLTTETLNQVCASGMRSVTLAETMIRAGDYEVVLAGGMESMSNCPYLLPKARWGARMGDFAAVDSMVHDGLLDAFERVNMVRFGTEGARRWGISREEQDRWALRSHRRAAAATDEGRLAEEIVGIKVPGGKGRAEFVERDEPIRRDTSLEKLAALPPLDEGGTVTAGNAPGVTDGAAALVVAGEGFARRRNLEPLGTIVAHAKVAEEPPNLPTVPGNAGLLALQKAGWRAEDLDLVEINEAFAVVAIHSARMLGVDEEIVNVNGGALALGHPIGASGARILMTLLYELRRRGGGRGLAAICSGGGQGDAVLVEV
ncbi:Acetyl-CoA C-acetyltransferase [Rubrobacter xylanophilus DSM 9941]|uniref:Probable acetyl-CoA acetyltransferase n=1 Tax=Rubrobacter xylanophilus (strain DSM 9941 / JCM 11954 / NBRC 16129 / PRD-1) TaxID=266117 RepID=Q1AT31_RUBXD|nr:acetyl-CoA C-acetyltransferase [Rubrobacter xylanophilus]ABG05447.1 Acetyl-CoA C-acetyltransferase [Rubrobacter xylanophilus DSM 9941]